MNYPRMLALGLALFTAPAYADVAAKYSCEGSNNFTINFLDQDDYQFAIVTFSRTKKQIVMQNQKSNSGAQFSGGGWFYYEKQQKASIENLDSKKLYVCKSTK